MPLHVTAPERLPEPVQLVAFVVAIVRVEDCPSVIVAGEAEIATVGAGVVPPPLPELSPPLLPQPASPATAKASNAQPALFQSMSHHRAEFARKHFNRCRCAPSVLQPLASASEILRPGALHLASEWDFCPVFHRPTLSTEFAQLVSSPSDTKPSYYRHRRKIERGGKSARSHDRTPIAGYPTNVSQILAEVRIQPL